LNDLTEEEREVIRLTHYDGYTHSQAAEVLGVSVGTVKSRSHRAHRRLAALLAHLLDE
jgi:RNA polymerase sigma-70 factor (ECF subfamily)